MQEIMELVLRNPEADPAAEDGNEVGDAPKYCQLSEEHVHTHTHPRCG